MSQSTRNFTHNWRKASRY